MRILITGICGFAGSTIALALHEASPADKIFGCDNFVRPGSEINRARLRKAGIEVQHVDLRMASDMSILPAADWVIDAAANPSVLAGVDGLTSSRQIIEHNLIGTVNVLEYCKQHRAGLILLSTSRVYSINELKRIKLRVEGKAYRPDGEWKSGIAEEFSTEPPLSLYGTTKLASEKLALEYGAAFDLPIWINRCGVLAGAGQFGRGDQGIFSFWIHSWARRRPLRYIGFEGKGHQTRDCLHPRDLIPLLQAQMSVLEKDQRVFNVSGGMENSISLAQLSDWCAQRFGKIDIGAEKETRAFDVPWLVLDSARAKETWNWKVETPIADVLEEIAVHAEKNPDWLELAQS